MFEPFDDEEINSLDDMDATPDSGTKTSGATATTDDEDDDMLGGGSDVGGSGASGDGKRSRTYFQRCVQVGKTVCHPPLTRPGGP